MLDFRELSTSGTEFELLVREVLFAKGLDTTWSGVGSDGGKDLICIENINSVFGRSTRRWLVQCKHFAHANRSVGISDVDSIADSCAHHGAVGYVLATSTYVSSGLVGRLDGIAANSENRLLTAYIDGAMIERMLLSPALFHVAQRFFPVSASNHEWQVSRTDRPNHFIVNYKGYIFHLTNRIGSNPDYHFGTIRNRIEDIEKIDMPEGHLLRPRAFWYDDKNGGYSVHLDYMIPHGKSERPYSERSIARALGDGDVLEDGQFYNFDVITRRYIPTSDHYDPDHYNYYTPYIGSFLIGEGRDRSTVPTGDRGIVFSNYEDDQVDLLDAEGTVFDAGATRAFEEFASVARQAIGIERLSFENATPEILESLMDPGGRKKIDTFSIKWTFDTATLRISSSRRKELYRFLEMLDQGPTVSFFCSEGWTFVPGDDGRAVRSFDDAKERLLFVEFSSMFAASPAEIRSQLNEYFSAMAARVSAELGRSKPPKTSRTEIHDAEVGPATSD